MNRRRARGTRTWRASSGGGEAEDAETEVLLKWKGTAFVHCTWAKVTAIESDVVSGAHGKMRVARFFDKFPQQLGPCVERQASVFGRGQSVFKV